MDVKIKKWIIAITVVSFLASCTTSKNFYTGEEDLAYNEEFSLFNTILLPIAIVGIVGLAYGASQGGTSNNSISCRGYYCGYDAAWDYLPGSDQYRCRDTSNGQFVYDYYCASQTKQDNWY